MAHRALNWRLAVVVAGLVLIVGWALAREGRDPYVILVEFGTAPEILEGAEVVVDGEVAGTLRRMGARTQTGFRVAEGRHEVFLRMEGYPPDTARITTGFGAGRVRLMADFANRYVEGESRTYVVLTR